MHAKSHRWSWRTLLVCLTIGALATIVARLDSTVRAQDGGGSSAAAGQPAANAEQAVKDALQQRVTVEFLDTPLADVLEFLKSRLGVQIVTKDAALSASGLATDAPISLHLEDVRAETALDLILSASGADQLVYYTRDNLIIVTSKDDLSNTLTTRIYDVRDIVQAAVANPTGAAGMMGGGDWSGAAGMTMPGGSGAMPGGGAMMSSRMMGGMGMAPMGSSMMVAGGMSSGAGMGPSGPDMGAGPGGTSDQQQLAGILESVIEPTSWETGGGPGVIRSLSGILIVRQTERVHSELDRLLDQMRDAYGISEQATE